MKTLITTILISTLALIGCQSEQISNEIANQEIEETSQALVGGLQINEVSIRGTKFVELFNGGSSALSLTGMKVASGRSDTGVDLASACSVSGTLNAGSYVSFTSTQCPSIVWSDPDGSGPVNRVFYVLNSSNAVVESVTYPNPDGTPVQQCTCRYNAFGQYVCSALVPSIGLTWAALPNGGDCFGVGSPTPGAAN